MSASKSKVVWPRHKARTSHGPVKVIDIEGIKNKISEVSNQLFKQDGTVEVIACQWNDKENVAPKPIRSYSQLDSYLVGEFETNQASLRPLTHLFLIDQLHSKSGLDISEAGLNLLLDRIDAFPQLGNALSAFVASDTPYHEGRSDFYASQADPSDYHYSLELCMLLKYVELNGNRSDPVPYSIRQMLFYQNFQNERDAMVLIRPSAVTKRRIQEEFFANSRSTNHWTNMPTILISTLSLNWAEYAKFLDAGVWKIEKSSNFTNPFMREIGETSYETLQTTKKYHDLLTRATHVLQNNIRILESLSRVAETRKAISNGERGFEHHYNLLQTTIEDQKFQLSSYIQHFNLIHTRLTRITEAIRDSIALRSSDHAAIESDNMRHLTYQSIREARTVKAIALVTLIYLPATFVATFLGMQYITVTGSRDQGRLAVNVQPDLWIYLAITAPLTLGTLLGWWAWERWNQGGKGKADIRKLQSSGDAQTV